ncbi:F-box/LRR-repeat protein at3g59200 [Phtheirospermum japonicum]|uniref:F-box/LRR-repeat protein at3g59200 n=1 Tax=Phtheirospermum japonicum TaxID=374723 RepID=A0A830CZH4_9LAMI|nr:F-box/LRR-repeat protein at3g59200 [Phtheirospermum japonicum]
METARQSNEVSDEVSIDRLSCLPDDVLSRILSFLPPKLSTSTSILAQRWRFLWAHVPNLYFDSNDHHSRMRFLSIINNVMLLHKMQSITTFRLSYLDFDSSEFTLETWIASAIERNVRVIHLQLHVGVKLPQCLLTCKTLVNLRLDNCSWVPSSGAVYFPSLKRLYLFSVEYDVDEDLPHLLAGCPVLEDLTLSCVMERGRGCCYISSPTVKKLTIDFPNDDTEFFNPYSMVKINTPSLLYLEVLDCLYDRLSVSPMPDLIEAYILFEIYALEVEYNFYTRCVSRFIDSLHNVKGLILSGRSEEFIDLGVASHYVRFDNLTKLELTADWRFFPKFLESANNLEVLVIHQLGPKYLKLEDVFIYYQIECGLFIIAGNYIAFIKC